MKLSLEKYYQLIFLYLLARCHILYIYGIFHYLFLVVTIIFLFNDNENNFYNLDLTIYLILITLTFILSYYSWRYIEQPFRQKKIPTKLLLSSCLFGFIIIFSSGYFINKNDGLIERFPKKAVTFLNYNYSQSPKILINSCQESLILKIKHKILFQKYEKKNIFNFCRKLGVNNIQANTVLMETALIMACLSH